MKSIVACAVAMAMLSFGANAADQGHGKVNFKGSIINAPCGIAPESADQSIDFGQISKAHLNNGGISTKKDVDIKLVNCEFGDPAAGNTVSVTFSGTTVGTTDTLGLSDTNAVIKMTGQDGKYVQFDGKTAGNTTALIKGDNTLHYQAWVQKGAQAVTEGDFTAVANFTLAYK